MKLLTRLFKRTPKPEPKTHDYTSERRRWGHDYAITQVKDNTINICGWGYGLSKGDYFVFTNQKTHDSTRYQIKKIEYYADPTDMWRAEMVFAPRPGRLPPTSSSEPLRADKAGRS